jgi:hypothetical protein
MDLLHLVDRLEELVASAQKMPIGNRAIIDRRRLLDIIDQMRIAVPEEVREAQDIVGHREAIRREAEEDGRILLAQAEERASRMVEASEITVAAKRRAEEIAAEAEARLEQRVDEANADIQQRIQESRQIAREQMSAADEYARELLRRLERQLETFVSSVRSGMQQLEPGVDLRSSQRQPDYAPRDDDFEARADEMRDSMRDIAREPQMRSSIDERAPEREPAAVDRSRRMGDYPAPAPSRATRAPIPLHRDEESEEEEEELENLLQPRRTESPRPPALIDDFENEPLDDDPLLGRRDREDER